MTDQLERLFDVLEEEIEEVDVLEISVTALPRGEDMTEKLEDVSASASLHAFQTEGATAVGGGMMMDETGNVMERRTLELGYLGRETTLVSRMAREERRAQLAQGLVQSGVAVREERRPFLERVSVNGGLSVRSVDRAMERDARRYDGGFMLE